MKQYQNKKYLQGCLDKKWSIRRIAKENEVDFTTVFKYVKQFELKFPKGKEKDSPQGKDRVGQRVGILTISKCLGFHIKGKSKIPYFEYKCDCGNKGTIAYQQLWTQQSCGCLKNSVSGNIEYESIDREDSGAFNILYASYRIGAIKRLLLFNLSKKEFAELIASNCEYCGSEPSNVFKYRKKGKIYPDCIYNGIDRVDNNKGYVLKNCVTCCVTCNRAKRSMTLQAFEQWIQKIINHNQKENDRNLD